MTSQNAGSGPQLMTSFSAPQSARIVSALCFVSYLSAETIARSRANISAPTTHLYKAF